MPNPVTLFSVTDIGNLEKKHNDDHTAHGFLTTLGGGELAYIIVCDGVSQSDTGSAVAKETTDTIIQVLKTSSQHSIPELLIEAITVANRAAHELNRTSGFPGYSTAALLVIDLAQKPSGRLYIASIGDSPIFLIRQGQTPPMIRLNMDHNRFNQAILEGINPQEAAYLERAYALTRAIGATPEIEPDLGFYGEELTPKLVRSAQKRGYVGMQLHEGDTIIACTDGITDPSPQDQLPFVREEEFLAHALDDDAERVARTLISYALKRRPNDNISVGVMLVAGKRGPTTGPARLSARQKGLLALGVIIAVATIAILTALFVQSRQETQALEAAQAQQITQEAQLTQTALSIAATLTAFPTQTASPTITASPSPTITPSMTPTQRPTLSVRDEVGFIRDGIVSSSILDGQTIATSENPRLLVIDNGGKADQPSQFYLASQTVLGLEAISETHLEWFINTGSNVFVESGQYATGGVTISLGDNANVQLTGQATCMAVSYQAQNVTFGCYAAEDDVCQYETQRGQTIPLAGYRQVTLDKEGNRLGGVQAIPYSEAKAYYDLIATSLTLAVPSCLTRLVDQDQDTVLDQDEGSPECINEVGNPDLAGCPDRDGDGLHDFIDECPNTAATNTTNGCPLIPDSDGDGLNDANDSCPQDASDTDTGCLPDGDSDTIPDVRDACPVEVGNPALQGCPGDISIITPSPALKASTTP